MNAAALALPKRSRGRRHQSSSRLAVAYVRASTGKQRLTIDAQREAIEAFAAQYGLTIIEEVVDQISGAAPLAKRAELWRAIESAKERRAGALLVVRRDRLARDSLVAELLTRDLAAAGIAVVAVDGNNGDSPHDRLIRKILDSVAEFERELIAARTAAVLRSKKARGLKSNSTAAFGFRVDGERVVEDEGEQRTIRRIYEMRGNPDNPGMSITEITEALNSKPDRFPPRGERWHRTTVARLLHNHGVDGSRI